MPNHKIFIDASPKNPKIPTSPFDWTHTTNISNRFGNVNCIYMQYVPPKSKLKIKPMFAFDMSPFVFPIQTNVRCHLKFYKVPLRILWKDFEDFVPQLGTDGLPVNSGSSQFVVPYIKRPTGWNGVGSLAEQIGCCNQRLVEFSTINNYELQPFKGGIQRIFSGNAIVKLPADSSGSSYFASVILPPSTVLKNRDYASLSEFTGNFRFLSTVNNESLVSGTKLIVHVCQLGYDDAMQRSILPNGSYADPRDWRHFDNGFSVGYSVEVSNISTSVSSFNNSTSSSVFLSPSSSSSVVISGQTLYERSVSFKVIDDNFFSAIRNLQAHGAGAVLVFEFVGSLQQLLFPPFDVPSVDFTSDVEFEPTKVESTQGGFDISSARQDLVVFNKLGLLRSVRLATASIVSEIDTKFDSVNGADPAKPICALPFRALEFIHNYFGRNPRIDPFFKDGKPTYNRFLTNDESGADSTTPVDSWNALYETDYFTSCVKEPQFGNAPLVGVTVNDTGDTGILTFRDDDVQDSYEVQLDINTEGQVLPLTAYKESADRPNVHRLQELIKFGISINDLRNVSTFQRMLERLQRTSYRYANVIYEFFGTHPPVGDHYPQYCGGVTRDIMIDKITNVAQSESAALGEVGGTGYFRFPNGKEKVYPVEIYTSEPCYVVGIQYFTVTPTYSQYLPKHLLYKDPFDFFINPEFAFIGPQPVRKIEIAPNQCTEENMDDVFGYNRPYAELFSNVDTVHGRYKTDMQNYLLQRLFAQAPELNKSFIEINQDDLLNVFAVQTTNDKLFGQVKLKIHAELPAPRSYQPRSI